MSRFVASLVILLLGFASGVSEAQAKSAEARHMSLQISSTSFLAGRTIPKKFTCDGEDLSPALAWTGSPQSTKSFALIVDDPDAPTGTWNHWLIWNIPASSTHLHEDVAKEHQLSTGDRQGTNDFRKIGYSGPCPPPGKAHRYFFQLFALDSLLTLPAGATRTELDAALKSRVIARTELMGRYGR